MKIKLRRSYVDYCKTLNYGSLVIGKTILNWFKWCNSKVILTKLKIVIFTHTHKKKSLTCLFRPVTECFSQ